VVQFPAAADPAAQDRERILAQAAGEVHDGLKKREGGQPQDCAAVEWLVSAGFITGQTIVVDGGMQNRAQRRRRLL
jgi:NAD(P)-dependent dehydrogenase (short-subunit alcohol dehydrogenase family)